MGHGEYANVNGLRLYYEIHGTGELRGGGQRDAGWDGSGMPNARLAILPATTHYDIFASPLLAPIVIPFLDAPLPT